MASATPSSARWWTGWTWSGRSNRSRRPPRDPTRTSPWTPWSSSRRRRSEHHPAAVADSARRWHEFARFVSAAGRGDLGEEVGLGLAQHVPGGDEPVSPDATVDEGARLVHIAAAGHHQGLRRTADAEDGEGELAER